MVELTENDITEYFIQSRKADALGGKIESRMNEVIDLLCKSFKCHFEWHGSDNDYYEPKLSEILRDGYVYAGDFSGKLHDAYPDGFEIELLFVENDQIVEKTRSIIDEVEKERNAHKEKTKIYREKKKTLEARLAEERKKIKKELGIR